MTRQGRRRNKAAAIRTEARGAISRLLKHASLRASRRRSYIYGSGLRKQQQQQLSRAAAISKTSRPRTPRAGSSKKSRLFRFISSFASSSVSFLTLSLSVALPVLPFGPFFVAFRFPFSRAKGFSAPLHRSSTFYTRARAPQAFTVFS